MLVDESQLSHFLCLKTSAHVAFPGRGGYSQKNWAGVCGPLLRTLAQFVTKICDISYLIYDLTKN